MTVAPLSPERLYTACDPESLGFETTADIDPDAGLVGQDRALDALAFATDMKRQGYNLFVVGPSGAGQRKAVESFVCAKAAAEAPPADYVYVNNFEVQHKPIALRFAPGGGRIFKDTVAGIIDELQATVPAVLESEDYQNRRQSIESEFNERQEEAFEEIRKKAEAQGTAVMRTPQGFGMAPMENGQVMKPESFNALPEERRKEIEQTIQALQKELAETLEQLPGWQKEARERLVSLNKEIAARTVQRAFANADHNFSENRDADRWLNALADDLIENIGLFGGAEPQNQQQQMMMQLMQLRGGGAPDPATQLRRYEVNLLVSHEAGGSGPQGAPVVMEDHPTLGNLVGRIEHLPQMGALVTDFTLIKPGSLHMANGGYLLVDALRLLREPLAWEALKRAIRRRQLVIESAGDYLNLVSTISLEPDPIPMDVKIVLFGDRMLHYMLSTADPDFSELFKVVADIDDQIDRNAANARALAAKFAAIVRDEELLPIGKDGVARLVEQASRMAADQERLTAVTEPLIDLLHEADFLARKGGAGRIGSAEIDQAIERQRARAGSMRERTQEVITRDIVMIDTDGEAVGQINGLSVLSLGNVSFGRPSRITAAVRMGGSGGRIIDIEREVKLSGPLHSKGVLILSGYLASHFCPDAPLSLSASLVFEQSYGGVDGDSASSTELYALLSALSGVPIRQGLAVTGSVNQRGEVQAIGGANEKIEGYFDICAARGLTGGQGVLIPKANAVHLMLRKEVRDAVAEGKFAVYAVETIEEGIELLTGAPAGRRQADGTFPEGTVFEKVEARLRGFAEAGYRFSHRGAGNDDDEKPGAGEAGGAA